MMVATRETLRSWFYRPWFLAMIAAVLSASLLITGGLFVAVRQVEQSESQEMNAQGERFLARLEQLFGQLRESLDDLEAQPLRSCDDEMIATLQQVTFNYRFVYEAAYMDATRICSNRPRQEGLSVIRPPDIKGPTYSYWLNTTTEPDENRAALMLGRGNFRVATSRGHLTDMVDLLPGSSLLVVLDHGTRAIPVLGVPQVWPPTEPWPPKTPNALQVTQSHLIYRMPTDNPEYQLVLISPRSGMHIPELWWWMVPFCLVLGALVGVLVFWVVRQRQSLDAELHGAIRRGELQVLYQPIFDLDSRNCVGAEALLRWRRPDGTLTSPDLFIPMAENTGQIRQMTDFVLQRLLEQLGQLLRANPQLYISVNLAACDVMVPRIGQVMARLLTLHRVAARQIAFEVTERGLIDVVVARENLQALRDVGHQVLIDDFGTGYCSLAYLQTLPVDCLKIDKAFIDALGHDAASSGVAPHIIHMAQALDLKVIAEGIEFESQAALLSSEGVKFGQGWLFAHALSAVQFIELITRGRRLAGRRIDDEA
ncbi:sensor c-di-GMP phosphodiesterase-like protein [Pseudomonas sp. LAIL14HWK12:I2]|uniref:cyclic-guanylate-specific phosphodiesterase n=2 Tax=Pseudomonas TaxID=286 RepID=A0AAE2ABA2_PSEFL|nr:diguanylate phosphodiesterase [Pseudomonas fluorescens]POA38462.1 cyclic diguanylate phosphodiesterase [Pseudomonas sp. GW456-12-1-14-TSB6]TFA83236.1 sensor c-di-GMP phosphodiesterase-like protein [Pseudomonas sp. LAIL14HWK12:I2]SCZ35224.1 sensor c-di-GMP phosphodiesterase, contains CSS-motif sensor and EAL domain [Pseudomonas sp. NFIX46]SDB38416.1 sensor c-di-GMP phosphodiesterase, contains CSS-motif sensor and EAL domain [Pseudomonas putida]SFQ90644.1 sensor c-di-GMP phosphodiesterase, co